MSTTTNYGLALPNFDVATWHDELNNNFRALDAILALFVPSSIIGIWQNATVYAIGDRAADSATNEVYQCAVAHTSAVTPTTFASDRTANPTFWTLLGTATITDMDGLSDATITSVATSDILYWNGTAWVNAQPNNAGVATSNQGALADTALQPSDVGSAASSAVSDFATAAQGAKADTAAQLAIANIFTETQRITSTDSGASGGPSMELSRESPSPAVNDNLGIVVYRGHNSALASKFFAVISAVIVDPTAGSEDGRIDFRTMVAGVDTRRLSIQQGVHSTNSGGDKGLDTANFVAYYINTVFWSAGTGTPEGVVTAPVGSFFSRTDGGAGTSFYVKESGAGNTGWVGK